jgi:hypothetical protein
MRNIYKFQWCWEFLKAFQQECQKSKCNRHHIGTSLHWSHIGWWVKADVICICYKDSTTGYHQCQSQVRNSWTFKDSNLMSPPRFNWSMSTATIVDHVTVVCLSKSIPKRRYEKPLHCVWHHINDKQHIPEWNSEFLLPARAQHWPDLFYSFPTFKSDVMIQHE